MKEAEAILDNPSWLCNYIEFDLVFEQSAIQKQCKRPRRRKVWLVISDKADAASKPRALVTQGDL